MTGTIMVSYKILCKSDLNLEVAIAQLLQNEKVAKVIKSEFAKGYRNIEILSHEDIKITIESIKEIHSFEVDKNDFADILVLAEEDAAAKKLFKKECERVELVDISTQ